MELGSIGMGSASLVLTDICRGKAVPLSHPFPVQLAKVLPAQSTVCMPMPTAGRRRAPAGSVMGSGLHVPARQLQRGRGLQPHGDSTNLLRLRSVPAPRVLPSLPGWNL